MALHANEELLVRAQPSRGQKPFPLRQTNSPSSQSRDSMFSLTQNPLGSGSVGRN